MSEREINVQNGQTHAVNHSHSLSDIPAGSGQQWVLQMVWLLLGDRVSGVDSTVYMPDRCRSSSGTLMYL